MTTDEQSDRLTGEVLDTRFRLERVLGSGGMGKVYAGHQLSVDRLVAIKVLREELSESDSLAQRFFREAKVVASLRHPNIVGLVEFGRDPERGLLYIAMEYVDGTSLGQLLRRGRVDTPLAVAVARQVCSALAEAHAAGVIHRDLKPDNIMLVTTAEGALSVKVLDFGIALPTGEEARLTSTGAVVGTPHYMAPEQSQDQAVTPRADLYALGVMLYEMLSGRLPFTADTPMAVLLKAITQPPPPLSTVIAPEAAPPAALVELVETLMQKDPANRPASVSEVGRRLDEIASSQGLSAPRLAPGETLDSLVVARASDEFVFGATIDSPVPAPAPVPSTADVRGKPAAKVPERRKFKKRWLLGLLVPLSCCIFCLRAPENAAKKASVDATLEPHDTGVEHADVAGPLAAAVPDVGAPELPERPVARAAKPAAPPEPPPKPPDARPSEPAPAAAPPAAVNLFEAQMEAGGICELPRCDFRGTRRPGAAVCQGDSDCTAKCPISGCPQVCNDEADCDYSCSGGSCEQTCSGQANCELSCSGGNCKQACVGQADCSMTCSGGNCRQTCATSGSCKKTCLGNGCG